MRALLIAIAALATVLTVACSPKAPADAPLGGDCNHAVTRTVAFTAVNAHDLVEARSLGASCDTAVVVWTIRDAAGKPLWTHAAPYAWLSTSSDTRSVAEMMTFLEGWAGVAVDDTSASPVWAHDKEVGPEGWGASGGSMFTRDTYETIRTERLPRICVPTTSERYQCIFYDAQAEAVDVHFAGGA